MAVRRVLIPCSFLVIVLLRTFGTTNAVDTARFGGLSWTFNPSRINPAPNPSPGSLSVIAAVSPITSSILGDRLWAMDFYASDNSQGTGTRYYLKEQILSEEQQGLSLDSTLQELNFNVDVDMELYGIGCAEGQPSFLCVRFYQGESTSFLFPSYGSSPGITACQRTRCQVRSQHGGGGGGGGSQSGGGGGQLSQARIQRLMWNIAPFSMQRGRPSSIDLSVEVFGSSRSDTIQGSGLWNVNMYGSDNREGTGLRYNPNTNLLSPGEASKPLRPGQTLTLNVNTQYDVGSIGCGDASHLCVEFEQGRNPNPPFNFPLSGGRASVVSCQRRDCAFDRPMTPGGRALFSRFSYVATSGSNRAPQGYTNMDLGVTASTRGTSDSISGNNLWKLSVFGSRNRDGSGPRRNEVQNVLDDRASSSPLTPGRDLVLEANSNLNLNGIGSGTDYPYLCLEFGKGEQPQPNFELPLSSGAGVSCTEFEGEPTPTLYVTSFSTDISLSRRDNPDGTTPTTVSATVGTSGHDSPITGTNLWRLGVVGSSTPDGSGETVDIVDQILTPEDSDQPKIPNEPLSFEVTDNLNLNSIGPGTPYPYICTKFSKHPLADPPFELEMQGRDSILTCTVNPREPVLVEPPQPPEDLEVVVASVKPQQGVKVTSDSSDNDVTFQVDVTVNPDETDDIEGEDLWELDVWVSKKKNGKGKKLGLSSQVLDDVQQDQPLASEGPLTFEEVNTNLDLTKVKCKDAKYLCAEIKKQGGSSVDFGFRGETDTSTVGCAKITCKKNKSPKGVIVESVQPTPIMVYENEVNEFEFDSTITFDQKSKPVSKGKNFWKLGAWLSNDPSSPKRIGEQEQVLSDKKRDKKIYSYDEPTVFGGLPMTVDLTGIPCKKVKFLCNKLKLDKPNPKFSLDKAAKNADMGCAPVMCKVPGEEEEPPVMEVIATTTTPVTLFLNENNDVTTTPTVLFDADEDIISRDSWEVSTWFSKRPDGTGPKSDLVEEVLSQVDKHKPVTVDESLTFPDLPQNVDLTDGSDCSNRKYICAEIRKDNPSPDFELVERQKFARRGCAQVTCKERSEDVPTVEFASVEPTPVTLYLGEKNKVTTDVAVGFNEETTTPDTIGQELWQMAVWFSKFDTGKGAKKSLVKSAMTDAQGEMPVDFENFVAEDLPLTADLRDVEDCAKYQYVCARIRKDTPSPDYEQLGTDQTGCAPVTCETREEDPDAPEDEEDPEDPTDLKPYDDTPKYPTATYLEVVETTAQPVVLHPGEENDVTTDVVVQFDTPYVIKGGNLWEMSTWFSKYPDGSGPKLNPKKRNLNQKQKDKPAKIDEDLNLEGLEQYVDLSESSDCGNYKYICAEISKDRPNPDFEIVNRYRDSRRGCAQVTCEVREETPVPSVEFASVTPTAVTLVPGKKNKVNTDVSVMFNEDTTDPTVAGEELWQMSVWFSKSEVGSGQARGHVKSALSDEQGQMPVDFENFVAEGLAVVADLRDLESCNKFAYICAKVRKDKPKPDYKQIGKDKMGCVPVICEDPDPSTDVDPEEPDPDAPYIEVVSTTTSPVTLFLNENNDVTTDVSVQFDTPYNIEGTDLWEMAIWFSKNKDGSGKQTNLREATLSENQQDKTVKVDKDLNFADLEQNVDLSDGTGCGKFRFICSEIRKNNPSPDFVLHDRYRYSRRGCAPVTCNERNVVQTPTVEFASVTPTPVTLYLGERNDVTTDVSVEFNEATTDPNVAGYELWQMSVWFSKSADGLGSVKSYVKSALSDVQGQMPVNFDEFVTEGLEISADLTDIVACNKYKYICARVRKDKPDPDYEQIGKDKTGCAPVTCEKREPDEYIEVVATTTTPVTLFLDENNDVTTDVKVEFEAPYKIEGTNLWEVSVWFSKYPDGSGKQTNLREKTLEQRQKDKTLKPDKELSFSELDQNVDLTDGSNCNAYKYICSEIRKNKPSPDYEMEQRYRDSRRGCAKVTCNARDEEQTPTVQFQSVQPTPIELTIGEKNKVTTDVTVRFNEENTDPDTAGEELWQMALWFSKDEDGVGSSTGFVESSLSDEQGTKPVDFNDFVMEDLPMTVDLRDKLSCSKYKFICARVRKDKPNPDYELIGKSQSAITGCAPVTCLNEPPPADEPFPPEQEEDPIIEVVSTSTTPVNLYINEVNDVTTDVEVQFDIEDPIKGTDLWEMAVWFSKLKDGSGKQTNLREAVLTPKQRSKGVKPDKNLKFADLPQSVDLSDGSGCGKFRYICSEIRKFNPSPDFKLNDRYKFSRRGCAQVTCDDRSAETPVVQFRQTQPTPVTLYIGENNEVTTDVTVKFKESITDPTVAGENLWQMALWFSKADDGQGSSTGFVESSLNEAQGSKPVDFDDFVMEDLPMIVDLTDAIGCGKYKYICARVRKDNPTPDYKLVGKDPAATTGCAPVTCETRESEEEEQILEIVSTTPTPVTLYTDERNEVTTDVTIVFDADYGVEGKDNWELSLWYSKASDGSGKQTGLDENTLSRPQRNQPLSIEEPLIFEAVPSVVDLTDGTGCGKYKYICAEIRKSNPQPNFDYTLRKPGSKRGCARVTCKVREEETPTVQFKSVQPTPVTLYVGQENDVTTDVTIEFDKDNTDESTAGTNLWELSLWFSKSETGVGSSTGMRDETLSQAQKDQPVNFDDFEFTGMEMSVDLTDAIGCGKYQYICARIRKNDPEPDYNLVGKDPKATTGCAPVTCEVPEEEVEEPLVIVSTTITPVTLYLGEPNSLFPDVTVEFEGEEGVSGTNLWEIEIFFNKNGDGSGKKVEPTTSTLTQSQKDQPLVITESLVFEEVFKPLDLSDAEGCGKYKYICAEIRKDNPSPPFEFEKKRPLSIRGCAKTSCETRENPEPTVQFASTQPSPVTIYEEEVNVVDTDVVVTFNEPNTDPTVEGVNLWQMTLWFSKSANGAGSSTGTIESALSEEQSNMPVDFNDFVFEDLKARADLTTQGCGKFKFICARIRKHKPDPSYELIGKDPSVRTGCAPVDCQRGREPTVEFASVQPTEVTVYEESQTTVETTVTVTFNEERTDEDVSGSSLWQVDLWFSKSETGLGSSTDGVTSVLSNVQASQPVSFSSFVFEDLEITADLRNSGCGKYRYICAQIRRDAPEPPYKLLGKDRTKSTGCAEVRCDRSQEPIVEFASVQPTPVTIYEDSENPVTTTVTVTFNEATTDPTVSGSNLWQMTLWFSKASDGQGSETGTVDSALSPAQGSMPVNFNNMVFEDLEITADLTTVGCGKFRYICARIRRDNPEPSYQLVSRVLTSTSGCAEVQCERARTSAVIVTSVTNTPVSIVPEENNQVTTDVTVTFDGSSDQVSGSNLWRVEVWYSKSETGSGFRSSLTDQALSTAQQNQALDGSFTLSFPAAIANADLRGVGCGKYQFVCARIKKGEANPDFELQDPGTESVTGCSPVTCGEAEEEQETPHIEPVSLSITEAAVTVGEVNTITVDVSIDFNQDNTDDVSGSDLWRIILWLSDQGNGKTGSRIAETDQTISSAQKNQPLSSGGPLSFQDVSVSMNLSREKCKKIRFVCGRLKKLSPSPPYTMDPSQVSGCAPCQCSS